VIRLFRRRGVNVAAVQMFLEQNRIGHTAVVPEPLWNGPRMHLPVVPSAPVAPKPAQPPEPKGEIGYSRGEVYRVIGEQTQMVGPVAIEFGGIDGLQLLVRVESGGAVARWGMFFGCRKVLSRDHGLVHIREAYAQDWRGYRVTVLCTTVRLSPLDDAVEREGAAR
jgi:hypothetical protein